ncbi:MAG: glycosyltransferase family 39 protein [Thermoanaerobaculia bacterium]
MIPRLPEDAAGGESRRATVALAVVAAAVFLMEFVPSFFGAYGYFIDELYYVACSERLALGYVDHPPLAPWLLRLVREVLGDSIPAIRLLPALCAAASVFLTGWMARRMGAGIYGQVLAALALALAPVPLILFGFFSMNAFGMLFWICACLILVEIARGGDPRLWLLFGAVAGVGLMNKHTFVLLAVGLAAGLVLTPERRFLAGKWLWLGAGLAFLFLLPNLWWQLQQGWPSLEFYKNADLLKNVPTPPWKVLVDQILFMNPASLPIWLGGLVFCLGGRDRRFRFLGWFFLALLVLVMVAQKSRPDRIVGAYPVMFAAGAVWWDAQRHRRGFGWTRWALPALLVVVGTALAPLSLPVLPPPQLASYSATLGIVPQLEQGAGKVSPLPQWFADRLGWEELVEKVAAAADELTPEERARALILMPSYGHAGALELLGRGNDLPRVVSGHNTYHLWGFGGEEPEALITVGYGPQSLSELFEDFRQVATYRCDYCMAWRQDAPIYVVRGRKASVREAWPDFKHFE